MPAHRTRILFLNHSASRTGGGILLLHFVRWLKQNSDFDLEVVSNGTGPLIDEFREVATTHVWRGRGYFLGSAPVVAAEWLKPRAEAAHMRLFLRGKHFDLVYANTAATAHLVAALRGCYDSLLWHVHELPYALKVLPGKPPVKRLFGHASRFIAVSQEVRRVLVEDYDVPTALVDLVHGFVPPGTCMTSGREAIRQEIRAKLRWPDRSFVIGGCGALGWRKGSDLFLQIGRRLRDSELGEHFRLLWVGGAAGEDDETLAFEADVRGLGLEGWCHRVPSTPDVSRYYCAMDAFALTSREDPFPLVMLEAAVHGLPVVCFAGSGGGPEFVSDGPGFDVPYANVEEFSARLLALHDSAELCRAMGDLGRELVETRYSIDTQGARLLESINAALVGSCNGVVLGKQVRACR